MEQIWTKWLMAPKIKVANLLAAPNSKPTSTRSVRNVNASPSRSPANRRIGVIPTGGLAVPTRTQVKRKSVDLGSLST
jgi:hypothetical protein